MDCLVENNIPSLSPKKLVQNINDSSDEDDQKCIIRRKITKTQTAISSSDENQKPYPDHNSTQGGRIKKKKKKLKQKFFNLLSSRNDTAVKNIDEDSDSNTSKESDVDDDNIHKNKPKKHTINHSVLDGSSDEDENDICQIKKKHKPKSKNNNGYKTNSTPSNYKPFEHTIDPSLLDKSSDEDEEENDIGEIKKSYKDVTKSKGHKTKTSTSPKRMTAKKAMENMQKIKSESNRMLREKDVSLPYHRPKALTLKDIMNRRKPALTSDGKSMPLKMNDEQLKQYAVMLEERQKEIIELCKSESEEDETINEEENNTENNTGEETLPNLEQNNLDEVNQQNENSLTIDNIINGEKLDGDKNNTQSQNNNNDNLNKENITHLEKPTSLDTELENSENCQLEENSIISENKEVNVNANELKSICDEEILNNCTDKESIEDNNFKTDEIKDTVNIKTQQIEEKKISNINNKEDSQMISLYYTDDTEKMDTNEMDENKVENSENNVENSENNIDINEENDKSNNSKEMGLMFSDDDDIEMEDIDRMIENADCETQLQPKLGGAPGMVINLEDDEQPTESKLTGVELLKERFTYFAKLRTPEEMEREKDKRFKPGTQHLKLKEELGNIIAEQRSLEWAKRLEEEKQKHLELKEIRGEDLDAEDDLDKIESKLDECDEIETKEIEDDLTSEEELIENDIDMTDKKSKSNPLIEDEAEESDIDNDNIKNEVENPKQSNSENEEDFEKNDSSSEDESSDESEIDEFKIVKKGRILKAFEDSDEEDTVNDNLEEKNNKNEKAGDIDDNSAVYNEKTAKNDDNSGQLQEPYHNTSMDEDLPSAQLHYSVSEDIFSQETPTIEPLDVANSVNNEDSITKTIEKHHEIPIDKTVNKIKNTEKVSVICDSQPYDEAQFENIVGMCSGSFSQNLVPTQFTKSTNLDSIEVISQDDSQAIGEDVLALCTGKFYDNQFVDKSDNNTEKPLIEEVKDSKPKSTNENITKENTLLQSILDELGDPEFDNPKPNKYFKDDNKREITKNDEPISVEKKRLVIESDDEEKIVEENKSKKSKKLKKKRMEKRALQISDDEDEEENIGEEEIATDGESDIDEFDGRPDGEENEVEYDSEENEVEVSKPKSKQKPKQFFEDEAELTSEDEWVGSGDEDESNLDRMEQEDGDKDHFHQGQLQRGLAKIHMRDVLDQDKREVRLIQELLFEDGDLGEGSRQRKFRWNNVDESGADVNPTLLDEFGDTPVEELESEEHWRRERHKREMFLRQMNQEAEETPSPNITINRTMIVKANLTSKTMSNLLLEVSSSTVEKTETVLELEKKTSKDIPSPVKKPFQLLQKQNCRGSLLSRGAVALCRLSSLAARTDPDPATASAPHRNYVFAALSPNAPVSTKRKADSNPGTPSLLKKLKTDEKNTTRRSLLDHINL